MPRVQAGWLLDGHRMHGHTGLFTVHHQHAQAQGGLWIVLKRGQGEVGDYQTDMRPLHSAATCNVHICCAGLLLPKQLLQQGYLMLRC